MFVVLWGQFIESKRPSIFLHSSLFELSLIALIHLMGTRQASTDVSTRQRAKVTMPDNGEMPLRRMGDLGADIPRIRTENSKQLHDDKAVFCDVLKLDDY